MASEQVEKLITFGKMALEQGWYDQAREHLEQALALDPSNQEAMRLLARVNEILSRREAVDVGVIRGGPVEPPLKSEILPAKQRAESLKQQFQRMSKRGVRLFGILAVAGGLLFAVSLLCCLSACNYSSFLPLLTPHNSLLTS